MLKPNADKLEPNEPKTIRFLILWNFTKIGFLIPLLRVDLPEVMLLKLDFL